MRNARLSICSAAFFTLACGRMAPPASDSLVQAFAAASCIPMVGMPGGATLTLRNGIEVSVEGAQVPGGPIVVTDRASGKIVLTADAGYYVNPVEVRFDPSTERLYVKAKRLAEGIWLVSDLSEYDLPARRLLQRTDASKTQLLADCQGLGPSRSHPPDGTPPPPTSRSH